MSPDKSMESVPKSMDSLGLNSRNSPHAMSYEERGSGSAEAVVIPCHII